jgi:prephenate dehydrogenase
MKNNFTIGIIGSGRFGGLLFDTFSNPPLPSLEHITESNFTPKIFSRSNSIDNKKFFSLDEVCQCDFLIPSVPISVFEEQVEKIKDLVGENTMVVDVCSVKMHPRDILINKLNQNVELLLTHPMFGPDSSKKGTDFTNLKFIFEKTRIKNEEKADIFLNFWKDLGCKMFELSCEEHDRQAAFTHAFAFLVGRIGIEMGIREYTITTKGFESLLYNQTAVENDSEQLFFDMFRYNPFVKEMLGKFNLSVEQIEERIKNLKY